MYIELRHLRTIRAIHQAGGLARAAKLPNLGKTGPRLFQCHQGRSGARFREQYGKFFTTVAANHIDPAQHLLQQLRQ